MAIHNNQTTHRQFKLLALGTLSLALCSFPQSAISAKKTANPNTGNTVLVAPTPISAQPASSSMIELNWADNNDSETGYVIERRSSNETDFSVAFITPSNATNYTDTSLNAGTSYSYKVKAIKEKRKSTEASPYSVIVTASTEEEIDSVAPSVNLINPQDKSTIFQSQTIGVQADASDNVGISKVEFYDHATLLHTDTTQPFEYIWNVDAQLNGEHQIKVVAYDEANNSNLSQVSITVDIDNTPPTVNLTNPVDGSNLTTAQILPISAEATDNNNVAKVEFFNDGVLISTDTTSPYTYNLAVDGAMNGTHVLSAKAYDDHGNSSISNNAALTVDIDVTPPTVAITNPSNNTVITSEQNIAIGATVADDNAIAKVEFYNNGILLSSDNTMPFEHNWSLDKSLNGSHNLTAIAFDEAGNQTTSSAINVNVDIQTVVPFEKDHFVDNGRMGPSSSFEAKGRMTELNGMRGLVYLKGMSQKWLYLWDDQGNESWVYLPTLDEDAVVNAQYIFTSDNEFWLFSSNGQPAYSRSGAPAEARRFQLSGAGALPDTAVLTETHSFGDQNSAAGSLIKLESGALVGAWYDMPATNPVNTAEMNFVYRDVNGNWSALPSITVDALPNHRHRIELAQHPVDNSIWAFSKGDSFRSIWAIRMIENLNGLEVDWVDDQFISQAADGLNGPEGELPTLIAAADPYQGTLLLAYQNNDFTIFSASPFVKGAKVTIAQITADATVDFVNFDNYVERLFGLGGLVVKQDGFWLTYRPIDQVTLNYDSVAISANTNGAWENPQNLGETYSISVVDSDALIAFAPDRAQVAITKEGGEVHLYTLD